MKDGIDIARGRPDKLPVTDVADHHLELAVAPPAGIVTLGAEPVDHSLEIAEGTRGEIVEDPDGRTTLEETLHEVRTDESCAARHEDRAHGCSSEADDRRARRAKLLHRVARVDDQRGPLGDVPVVEL